MTPKKSAHEKVRAEFERLYYPASKRTAKKAAAKKATAKKAAEKPATETS